MEKRVMGWTGTFFFYPIPEEKQTEQKGEGLFSVVID